MRDEQSEFEGEGFEQEKVGAIERAADKYAEKRVIWQGLGEEMKTLKAKVIEVVHANADKCNRTEEGVIQYHRADYHVVISTDEKVKVTIDNDGAGETE